MQAPKVDHAYKQAIVTRKDLNMRTGKIVAQCAHASVLCSNRAQAENYAVWLAWTSGGYKKVVLKVNSEKELLDLHEKANERGLVTDIVIDAGLTQVSANTPTALAILGKWDEVDAITGNLKLL